MLVNKERDKCIYLLLIKMRLFMRFIKLLSMFRSEIYLFI